jgi:hypothetical protein
VPVRGMDMLSPARILTGMWLQRLTWLTHRAMFTRPQSIREMLSLVWGTQDPTAIDMAGGVAASGGV